jgi:hypothetical protein
MPAISPALRPLVQDARLSTSDVATLRTAVQTGQATVEDVKTLVTRYTDALDAGVGSELKKLLSELGASAPTSAPIANLSSEPGLLNGLVKLPDAGRNHPAVATVQKGLIALASRTADPSMMLTKFGADGDYGSETIEAVKTFQGKKGLPVTGNIDLNTAQALDKALRDTRVPPIFAGGTEPAPRATMAKAASDIVSKRAQNYGVDDPWFNLDKNHALPSNVPLGGLKGKWKCNLFACNVMVAAGFEPPYYGNRGSGEYPNANQLYKWSDKHASQFGNASNVRFELRGEVMGLDQLDHTSKEDKLKALLATVQPGDMIIVDHMGTDVADGGHCRVVVENNFAADGTLKCAQASFDSAQTKTESLSSFTGEEHVWILRPNKPRAGGAVPVT